MKYPYIGKFQTSVKLFYAPSQYLVIESGHGVARHESNFKNITAEYLANTYGEVKSKEHAEFIVELATENDVKVWNRWCKGKYFNFHTDQNGGLNLEFSNEEYAKRNGEKQITIPLPPECESVDEWPKVGDDAILTNENDYDIAHGEEAIGEKVEIMSLFKDGDLDMAAIKHGITNYCFRVDMLQKPKTPEQELRDELTRVMQRNLTYEQMVNDLIENFNITKKPQ